MNLTEVFYAIYAIYNYSMNVLSVIKFHTVLLYVNIILGKK